MLRQPADQTGTRFSSGFGYVAVYAGRVVAQSPFAMFFQQMLNASGSALAGKHGNGYKDACIRSRRI